MKKLFFFVAFFGLVAFSANAQSCTGKKTASAKKSCAATCKATAASAAKLASLDENIEAKTCAKSGKLTYYKKSTCAKSGKVTSAEVQYDAATKKFVNVSPTAIAKEAAVGGTNAKKSCDPAACTKKTATAKKVSATTKKSCDPKNCDPAACKKSTKTAKVSNAKLVKATAEEN